MRLVIGSLSLLFFICCAPIILIVLAGVGVGIIGAIVGVLVGVLGGLFGAVAGIGGAVFGLIAGVVSHLGILLLIVLGVVLLVRSR